MRQILLPDELNIESVLAKSETKIKGSGAGPGAKAVARGGFRGRARVERFEVCIFTSM